MFWTPPSEKDLKKVAKKGPKMESKWNQYLEKASPGLILDAKKASVKNMFKKGHSEVSGTAREPDLGAPNKGKT